MPQPDAPASTSEHLSIGEVLALLREEFPDITISKIRFLESQGLIVPERTPSGYRKFFDADIETLRWVLRQQRDHFLPLKVIKAKLDARNGKPDDADLGGTEEQPSLFAGSTPASAEGGEEHQEVVADVIAAALAPGAADADASESTAAPSRRSRSSRAEGGAAAAPSGSHPSGGAGADAGEVQRDPAAWLAALQESPKGAPPPQPARQDPPLSALVEPLSDDTYSADQLAAEAGVEVEVVQQLAEFGLLVGSRFGGETVYDDAALAVTRAAAAILGKGVEARHLRGYKLAAEREVGLFEQLILPLLRQRNPDARQQAQAQLDELCAMGQRLREALIVQALHTHLRPR